MSLALIDGDIAAFRAAAVTAKDVNWETGATVTAGTLDPGTAAMAAVQSIRAWARLAQCKDITVTFTGRENWRRRIMPTYKANRAGKVKPQSYGYVVDRVRDAFNCLTVDGLEADDLMGILATTEKYADRAIIVTLDKDLRTVPGRHLHPLKDTEPVSVTEDEATYRWMMQTLMGDSSDGYAGIPRVGPVKAEKILGAVGGRLEDYWERVVKAYVKAGMTEDDALVHARVARILRRTDYDRTTKEVLLWHPTMPTRLRLPPG